ncbi:NAD(P)H-binding protein [Ralstonia sp. 1B3]|uniref:NAD(P)H-binding protein n=1 Tax=Ralstonia sp. 1B3 TaxID=2997421 RepID=UPI002FC97A03
MRRLLQVSTASYRAPQDGFALSSLAGVLFFKVMVRKAYDDIRATGELIANSDLDWTLVRIPFLKDGPANGRIDVGWYGRTKLGSKLSRVISRSSWFSRSLTRNSCGPHLASRMGEERPADNASDNQMASGG